MHVCFKDIADPTMVKSALRRGRDHVPKEGLRDIKTVQDLSVLKFEFKQMGLGVVRDSEEHTGYDFYSVHDHAP